MHITQPHGTSSSHGIASCPQKIACLTGVNPQGSFMYLLEHIVNQLKGEKLLLARTLMYKPWKCDSNLLHGHIPSEVFKQFKSIQKYCNAILNPKHKTFKVFRFEFRYVKLYAFTVISPKQAVTAQPYMLAMQESFVGQIIEDLPAEGLSFYSLQTQDQAAFISLYTLSYFCVWYIAGMFVSNNPLVEYKLVEDESIEEAIRLYWFGHQWGFQSDLADTIYRESIVREIQCSSNTIEQAVSLSTSVFSRFVDAVLDKYISFHEDFSHLIYEADKHTYDAMYRRAELICYFYLKSHENSKTSSVQDSLTVYNSTLPYDYNIAAVYEAGFSEEKLTALLAESERAPEGDAFIVRSGHNSLRLGMIKLKYAFNVYLKPMLVAMQKRGDWFDKKYIPAYLKHRVEGARYHFGAEVTAESEKEGKYDIDLLVADEDINRLYFCQIKHRVATMLPYFRDEFDEYTRNKQINYAVDQVLGTRGQFGSPTFLNKIRKSLQKGGASPQFIRKIDDEFLRKNAGFIVIHTIENLDFALKNGVAFYEWNTFRNLLRGQIVAHTKESIKMMALDIAGVALDDPNLLSSKLMEWSSKQNPDNPLHPGEQWFIHLNSYLQLTDCWDVKVWNKRIYSVRGNNFSFPIL
ncbi:MAG: hypothetical protein ACXWM2_03780 [Parachlamydiaceae bacterium]